MSNTDGTWLALLATAGLAAVGAARRGSRARLGEEDGIDLYAFRQELGFRPAMSIPSGSRAEGAVLRQGRAKANVGAMWTLTSERMYGSWVDLPIIATRETLQNSRDAIDDAWRKGLLTKEGGRFDVWIRDEGRTLEWADNGVGMDEDTFYDKFMSLADTTKLTGGGGGGFGLAKAVILAVASEYRWEMHTRDRRYVATGFDEPIRMYKAPFYQGTKLTIYDIDSKFDRWRIPGGGYVDLKDRLKVVLASNDLRSTKGGTVEGVKIRAHAGIRITLNGTEIRPMFRGRGRVLGAHLNWGRDTTARVKAYKRQHGGGATYVRLDGLYQFSQGFDTPVPFDVTVDLLTGLSPRNQGYPLTTSRNQLSGPPAEALRALRHDLTTDFLSATKEKSVIEVYEEDEGDLEEVEENRQTQADLLAALLADPDVVDALTRVEGGAEKLLAQEQKIQERRRRRDRVELAAQQSLPPGHPDRIEYPRAPSRAPGRAGLAGIAQQRVEKKKRRRKTNPFAGIAVFKINKAQFKSAQTRKYFERPERWHPLIMLWRLSVMLVLQEVGRRRVPPFQVGLILDDDIGAEYEYDAKKSRHILYLNPEWAAAQMKAYKGKPLAIAAIFHAKACHEITHLFGQGSHDEGFVALMGSLMTQTAGLLYPLTTLVERLLRKSTRRPRRTRKEKSDLFDRLLAQAQSATAPWDSGRGAANRPGLHAQILGRDPHADCPQCVRLQAPRLRGG